MPEPGSDRAAVAVGQAYDARADEYVERFGHVARLSHEDRALIERWRDSVRGPLLDAGCGPGHWMALLAEGGRPVLGVEVSERFLAHARRAHPHVAVVRADLQALPVADGAVGGVLAWFSTIHLEPARLPGALAELRRVLAPGGSLLLGYAAGPPGQSYPHAVTTAWFWSADALRPLLAACGLSVVEQQARHEEGARPSGALVGRLEPDPAPPGA